MTVRPPRRVAGPGPPEGSGPSADTARPRRDLLEAVRAALSSAADPERAARQQRYLKSTMPYYGLTSPQVRATVRPVLDGAAYRIGTRQAWAATVRAMWDEATHREERYVATALARHRFYRPWRDAGSLDLARHLVVTGAWWDHVDEIAIHLVGPVLRAERATVTPILERWADDADLWLRRTAILSQVGAKEDTDTRLLAGVIAANLEGSRFGGEFFIRKAIGWALREYARTDPEWVRDFVGRHGARLSGLSRREASKHL